jgi:exopolyphosphatase/pppGpp-phosphohydrolase
MLNQQAHSGKKFEINFEKFQQLAEKIQQFTQEEQADLEKMKQASHDDDRT